MEKRFSEMSKEELEQALIKYKEGAMKKHQAGFFSESAILEQKFYMAKSYLLNPSTFIPGKEYQVVGYEGPFTITYLNGVMAWGTFAGSEEEIAFPISRLS
ncbi:MAG TPA: YfhH family protein [Bacillota bacterium]|nr:YfhH family protein [Bacillota bacterium]